MKDFLTLRLQSHRLAKDFFATPGEVVKHYWCIQSQDLHQATRGIASRTLGCTQEMVKQACREGSIIRTWPMRGTLHYMAPECVHRMLDICAVKTLPGFAKRREFLGITDEYAQRALDLLSAALKGGKSLGRSEIGKLFSEGGIPMQTQRVYHLTCYAATKKLICFGPPTDKEETFVLLDEWVPQKKKYTLEESYTELAHMYIRSHGPCTSDDLAWWCGLSKGECKKAFGLVAHEFESLEYAGKQYFYAPIKTSLTLKKWAIRLLGWFDEYFLSYKDRSIVADVQHHGKLFSNNGIFFPLVMLDGKIVWTWKKLLKKNVLDIHMTLVDKNITLDKQTLEVQARTYADFLWIENVKITIEE